MNTINLSQKQSEIVNLGEGSFLVEASAGSGKTRVLTERVKKLLDRDKSKILAITFTNKASEELKDRINLNKTKNENIFVGTFHSFCQSILEARFKLLGFSKMPHIFEDESDRLEIVEEAIKSIPYFTGIFDDLETKDKPIYKAKALSFIASVKRELLEPEDLITEEGEENFLFLYNEYQDILKSNNAIDFDDIILFAYQLLANNEAVQNLYSKSFNYIFIDEGQDLNKAQYYLLKALCGKQIRNVMIVGDPNQSIYGFNGSTPKYMETLFVEDFDASKIILEENFRCSKKVIDAANKLMALNVEAINYVITGVFDIFKARSERDEANYVVQKINELIKMGSHDDIEGQIEYSSISILGRNKFVFKHIEDALEKNGIPFYFKSGNIGLTFSTIFMKLFDNYFRIKINPADKVHTKRLKNLLKIEDFNDDNQILKSKRPYFIYIKELVANLTEDNFQKSLKSLSETVTNINTFNDDEKAEICNEIEELKELWKQYSFNNLRPSLTGFKNTISLGVLKKESSQNGVCVSTVHTMKGQESEIVFLIGLDDGTFPYYLAIQNGGEDLIQEKNNLYVAFTRAKRFLYISYPSTRIMPWGDSKSRTISRFLKNF